MYIPIDINSLCSQLEEARNTLTYTLHLPYELEVFKDSLADKDFSGKIDEISAYTHKACSYLFKSEYIENDSTSKEPIFFGKEYPDKSQKQYPPGPLSILSNFLYSTTWDSMLIHHCFLATYDKLYNIIFQNIELNSYKISRHFNCWGVDSSFKKNGFSIEATQDNRFIFNKGLDKSTYGVVDSNVASNNAYNNYPSSFITLKNHLSCHSKYEKISNQVTILNDSKEISKKKTKKKTQDQEHTDISIFLNNLPLLQQLRGRGKELTNILKLYQGEKAINSKAMSNFRESVASIQSVSIKPTDGQKECCMTSVDNLYYKYKLELTFNFNLVYSISKNIESFDQRLNQRMYDDTTLIDVITSIVNFPNVFSRPLLVQMAFDSCSDHLQLDSTFLIKRVTDPDAVMYIDKPSVRKTDSHNFLNQWKDCYNSFIDYMSELIFPIYESYFFVTLYDAFSDPKKSEAENVLSLYLELGNYLSKDDVFSKISKNYYQDEILRINDRVCKEDFISYDYNVKKDLPPSFPKVVLSTYNHIPEDIPPLISRQYLYQNFKRTKECLLTSCTANLLK